MLTGDSDEKPETAKEVVDQATESERQAMSV